MNDAERITKKFVELRAAKWAAQEEFEEFKDWVKKGGKCPHSITWTKISVRRNAKDWDMRSQLTCSICDEPLEEAKKIDDNNQDRN